MHIAWVTRFEEAAMKHGLRLIALIFTLVACTSVLPRAQGAQGQKPPDTAAKPEQQAKPPASAQTAPGEIAPENYPPDFKAFNAAAAEKDVARRMQAFEKFIADNPKSILALQARSLLQSNLLTSMRDSQKKYLDLVAKQIEDAKPASGSTQPDFLVYSTYNRLAGDLLRNGVLLDEAEKYARTGLSLMDEQKYLAYRKETAERMAAARKERPAGTPAPAPSAAPAAAAGAPSPAAPAPAAGTPAAAAGAAAPTVMGFSMTTKDGVMVARPILPRPPSATPPAPSAPPRPPTDQDILAGFRSEKAGAQATLGQILVKRGKTDEGERLLKEAYNARPASSTMATIARVLAESAKKAGDDKAQMEYLATLALSGRITATESQDFEAVYKKAHGGSLDGIEEMLDARYRRDLPKLDIKPFERKPAVKGTAARAVLAEMFTGAG